MANKFTLCWDCKKATGGCSWSNKLRPVKGWTAQEVKPTSSKPYTTYLVEQCPEFKRDAYNSGLKRINNKE